MPFAGADPKDESGAPTPGRAAALIGSLGPWLALLALGWWTSSHDGLGLALAAAAVVLAVAFGWRNRGSAWGVGCVLVATAIVVGTVGERRVAGVLDDFDGYWTARDSVVGGILGIELERRVERGRAAAAELIAIANETEGSPDIGIVRDLRSEHDLTALALYDFNGELVAWDGVHRGRVPESVQSGEYWDLYHDLPLFGYLYATEIGPDGSTAVAAHLLRSALPEALGADVGDFATQFYRQTGERIRISEDDPGPWDGFVWDFVQGDRRFLSVIIERPDPGVRADEMTRRWSLAVSALVLLAWLFLALGPPRRLVKASMATGTLVLLSLWLPFDEIGVFAGTFRLGDFLLADPTGVSLGRFMVLCLAGFTLAGVLPRPKVRIGGIGAAAVVAVGFPLLLAWTSGGPAAGDLATDRLEWVVYQASVTAVLGLLMGTVLALARPKRAWEAALPIAIVVALLLGGGGAVWVWSTTTHPLWWAALWGLPAGLATVGVSGQTGWRRRALGWSVAIVLASTATIPVTWSHRVQARMLVAEERLSELAAYDDPALEGSLMRFATMADSLHRAASDDVSMLYNAWRLSGLADSGAPVWLRIHRPDGSDGEELRIGVERAEPQPMREALNEGWRFGGTQLLHLNRDDARYILTTTLSDDDIVSVVAPPFADELARSGLGPVIGGTDPAAVDPLTMIPLLPGDPHGGTGLTWTRARDGWQAEMPVGFANEVAYHAHYLVTLPGPLLAAARATLLLVVNVVLFFGFWLIGQGLVHDFSRRDLRLSRLVISFRARVTLALVGFFTLANALFGLVAFRTLTEASRRSAQVIAERVGEDAAGWYGAFGSQVDLLARQVDAELLQYRNGELQEGSVGELVELGLYEAWTPYPVHALLNAREVITDFTETSLGRLEYVTSYRRLPGGDILAAQVPLQAGMSAIGTTDLLELLGFFLIVGAGASLGLAMLAGRALTRPIRALQSASESVGAGDLGLRLPEDRADEFGSVFRAFNRMVSRVRRARRQLVRTSRRTQLIMDEAAVGMVALGPDGRVTLANPRAEALLGREVVVGAELPTAGELAEALSPWLDAFIRGDRNEADGELQTVDRRVRVRARRLGSEGSDRGVVLAMDDVTDELRAERVLAWGEMARQVAHEVKNPLTPIKLSVQHVRRAWEDRHPDFDDILLRNADAMLTEIERLAAIAQSFSRFGAPGEAAPPLAPVVVSDIVEDVMTLYRASDAPVRFEHHVDPGLAPVVARASELKEVLVNLLENARLAAREGTLVEVSAREGEDGSVVLVVTDDGTGIAEDVLPRIFEPQFSTRSTGTGLGLAIVRRLVLSWGGRVSVESRLGEGTSVTIALPAWDDDASAASPEAPESPKPGA